MCGIGGILRVWPAGEPPPPLHESIPEAWLNILDESIRHRGPDGQGRFRQRVVRADGATVDVALVHRRLSIIDHAGGGQPMLLGAGLTPEAQPAQSGKGTGDSSSPRERDEGERAARTGQLLWMAPAKSPPPGGLGEYREARAHVCPKCGPMAVVFNGCIYNHRELRRELQALGHEFHSDHSDTEVLLHGWAEWKHDLWERIDGMYAVVLWDGHSASWIDARDRTGEKPLSCEYISPTTLAYSSSAAALFTLRKRTEVDRSCPDADALGDWVSAGFGFGKSLFESSRSLHPQCSSELSCDERGVFVELGGVDVVAPVAQRSGAGIDATEVDQLLTNAVQRRLESDVPLGCFLSGGVDSSLIARKVVEIVPDLRTFCVSMPASGFDESAHAAEVARLLGSRHETITCDETPAHDLPRLIAQLGVPFGDSSLLPTHWVARATRDHVRVALAGDGGDELFAGYNRHSAAHLLNDWRCIMRWIPGFLLPETNPRSRSSLLRRFVRAAKGCGYYDLVAIFPSAMEARLLGTRRMRSKTRNNGVDWDLQHYLPEDILRKTDTASMAVGLEVRSPFLSRDIIKACLSAPLSNLMPGGQRKGLLRQVARKYFPAEIVDRPKQGFAIPIGDWFRTDYGGMRQQLYDHLEGPDPFPGLSLDINMKFVKRMLREHDAAGDKSLNPWHGRDHSQRLYMLLVLSIWSKWLAKL